MPVPTSLMDGATISGAAPEKRATIVSTMVVIDEMAPRRSLRETEDPVRPGIESDTPPLSLGCARDGSSIID